MNADFAAGVGWTSYRNEDKLDNTERNGTRGRGNLPPVYGHVRRIKTERQLTRRCRRKNDREENNNRNLEGSEDRV